MGRGELKACHSVELQTWDDEMDVNSYFYPNLPPYHPTTLPPYHPTSLPPYLLDRNLVLVFILVSYIDCLAMGRKYHQLIIGAAG